MTAPNTIQFKTQGNEEVVQAIDKEISQLNKLRATVDALNKESVKAFREALAAEQQNAQQLGATALQMDQLAAMSRKFEENIARANAKASEIDKVNPKVRTGANAMSVLALTAVGATNSLTGLAVALGTVADSLASLGPAGGKLAAMAPAIGAAFTVVAVGLSIYDSWQKRVEALTDKNKDLARAVKEIYLHTNQEEYLAKEQQIINQREKEIEQIQRERGFFEKLFGFHQQLVDQEIRGVKKRSDAELQQLDVVAKRQDEIDQRRIQGQTRTASLTALHQRYEAEREEILRTAETEKTALKDRQLRREQIDAQSAAIDARAREQIGLLDTQVAREQQLSHIRASSVTAAERLQNTNQLNAKLIELEGQRKAEVIGLDDKLFRSASERRAAEADINNLYAVRAQRIKEEARIEAQERLVALQATIRGLDFRLIHNRYEEERNQINQTTDVAINALRKRAIFDQDAIKEIQLLNTERTKQLELLDKEASHEQHVTELQSRQQELEAQVAARNQEGVRTALVRIEAATRLLELDKQSFGSAAERNAAERAITEEYKKRAGLTVGGQAGPDPREAALKRVGELEQQIAEEKKRFSQESQAFAVQQSKDTQAQAAAEVNLNKKHLERLDLLDEELKRAKATAGDAVRIDALQKVRTLEQQIAAEKKRYETESQALAKQTLQQMMSGSAIQFETEKQRVAAAQRLNQEHANRLTLLQSELQVQQSLANDPRPVALQKIKGIEQQIAEERKKYAQASEALARGQVGVEGDINRQHQDRLALLEGELQRQKEIASGTISQSAIQQNIAQIQFQLSSQEAARQKELDGLQRKKLSGSQAIAAEEDKINNKYKDRITLLQQELGTQKGLLILASTPQKAAPQRVGEYELKIIENEIQRTTELDDANKRVYKTDQDRADALQQINDRHNATRTALETEMGLQKQQLDLQIKSLSLNPYDQMVGQLEEFEKEKNDTIQKGEVYRTQAERVEAEKQKRLWHEMTMARINDERTLQNVLLNSRSQISRGFGNFIKNIKAIELGYEAAKDTVYALREGAESIAAFASGNWAAGAMHASAAIHFAAAAAVAAQEAGGGGRSGGGGGGGGGGGRSGPQESSRIGADFRGGGPGQTLKLEFVYIEKDASGRITKRIAQQLQRINDLNQPIRMGA